MLKASEALKLTQDSLSQKCDTAVKGLSMFSQIEALARTGVTYQELQLDVAQCKKDFGFHPKELAVLLEKLGYSTNCTYDKIDPNGADAPDAVMTLCISWER